MNGIYFPPVTRTIKTLLIINAAIFIPCELFPNVKLYVYSLFAVRPIAITEGLFIWQPFTYMFLHGGWLHIFFNMMMLWMFGSQLEEVWGSKEFLKFYLFTGTVAGIIIFVWNLTVAGPHSITLGASGAVFGVMLAYAVYWPDRELLFMMFFPLKTKYVVLLYAGVSFFSMVSGSGSGISHVGHLGGFIAGFVYLRYIRNINVLKSLSLGGATEFKEAVNMKKQRVLWKKRMREYEESREEARRVDELLSKISRDGIDSLSASERKFLKKAAERQRDQDETEH